MPCTIATFEAIRALCQERLSSYKRPTRIHTVGALLKNAVGKIGKKALHAPPGALAEPRLCRS